MASRPTSETSSRSSTSSDESAAEARAHSAVHVLKGAIFSVLGPKRFSLAKTGEGLAAGTLRVRSDGPPTDQELTRIEAAANGKIAEDAELLEFEMDRQEAQSHFGEGILDLCPAETGVLLNMVRIPDWEASCCNRSHVESTASICGLKIDGATFDEAAKEFDLKFHLS